MGGTRAFNSRGTFRHVAFWTAYGCYYIFNNGWDRHHGWRFTFPEQIVTEMPINMVFSYINLYLLLPWLFNKRRYLQYGFSLMCLLFLAGLADRFFSWLVWLPAERRLDPASSEPTEFWIMARIIKNAAEVFPIVATTMLLKLMRDALKNERKLRAIEKERYRAEKALLQAQINPHFLFNTLNSLYSLALDQSAKTPEIVLRLSELMNYMLYDATSDEVLVTEEIKYLKNLAAIEKIRFSDRLELSFQCHGDLDGKRIAPLLLLPLIENAFKHGVENGSGWVTIDLAVAGKKLYLKVENSFNKICSPERQGIGLQNIKKRLELLYPEKHELTLSRNDDVFIADLKLVLP